MKRITLDVSEKNESTAYPWWAIVDPRQMMNPDVHESASMVEGPFFSREEAETYLAQRRYAFGKRATVFCFSGRCSQKYRDAIDAAKEAANA